MKKKLLMLIIGITVTLAFSSCDHSPKKPAEKLYVYSFEDSAIISPEDSKIMIRKFLGMEDIVDSYRSDENIFYYVSKKDVSETFEQDLNNGNFTYNKSMTKYKGDFVPQLPSRTEAIRLSEHFLHDNKLSPRNKNELKVLHVGGLRASSVIDGKTAGPIIDKLVTVTYGRIIDDVPVMGPGSKIVVNLGDKGEVMGLIRRWRELSTTSQKVVQPEEIISQQEAEQMAIRQITREYGKNISYKILGSGKSYYDNNGKILQPVYIFEANIRMQDERIQPFNYLCVIPMLKNSSEPLSLTIIDPKAKEMIKSVGIGEKVPSRGSSLDAD